MSDKIKETFRHDGTIPIYLYLTIPKILCGSVEIIIGSEVAVDDKNGNLQAAWVSVGTVDYSTGVIIIFPVIGYVIDIITVKYLAQTE